MVAFGIFASNESAETWGVFDKFCLRCFPDPTHGLDIAEHVDITDQSKGGTFFFVALYVSYSFAKVDYFEWLFYLFLGVTSYEDNFENMELFFCQEHRCSNAKSHRPDYIQLVNYHTVEEVDEGIRDIASDWFKRFLGKVDNKRQFTAYLQTEGHAHLWGRRASQTTESMNRWNVGSRCLYVVQALIWTISVSTLHSNTCQSCTCYQLFTRFIYILYLLIIPYYTHQQVQMLNYFSVSH